MAKQEIYRPAELPLTPVSSSDFITGMYDQEIAKRIRSVIRAEAPVSERLLIKRVINSFGILKAGTNVRSVMEHVIAGADLKRTDGKYCTAYWKKTQDPETYRIFRVAASEEEKRDVLDVCEEEIACAAASVIRGHQEVIYGDLARETASLLGYTRMGNNVVDQMKAGIDLAVKRGFLRRKGSLYGEGKVK